MATNLKTKFMRIGRSGKTVDGRTIDAESLRQAAKNYDPKLYKALIWPEHFRWFNLGGVQSLKAEDNDEGGVDLFAILQPNDEYVYAVKNGQKLFTSMELMPNFRDDGEFYLTGVAATDNPASVATEQMHFSSAAKLEYHSEFIESEEHAVEPSLSFFKRIAKKFNHTDPQERENIMSTKALEDLQQQFTALQAELEKLKPAAADDKTEQTLAEQFAALTQKVEELSALVKKDDDNNGGVDAQAFAKVENALTALTEKFNAALKEELGTPAGENTDDDFETADLY